VISIEEEISLLLKDTGLTLGTAESATGGMIASLITNVPGSSLYFKGSVVSYSNDIKQNVLRVKAETLKQHGAVSQQTAAEMADGVRLLLQTDIGISDTGIAGPAGGSTTKPLGLFYLALSTAEDSFVEEHLFRGDRREIRQAATQAALAMLRLYLLRKHC